MGYHHHLSITSSRLVDALLGLVLSLGAATAGWAANEDSDAALTSNAALYYWKASAMLREPRTPVDFEILAFVEGDLDSLPPVVLQAKPETARWLLEESPALAALAEGGLFPDCVFPDAGGTDLNPPLTHLPAMTQLANRARRATKAYQFVDNMEGAAAIYLGLLRLASNLDQDQHLTSGLVGASILNEALVGLEEFAGAEPSSDPATVLSRYFASREPPIFHPGDYLVAMARRRSDWLLADPNAVQQRVTALYGTAKRRPAEDQLLTLSREKKIERLTQWLDDYRSRAEALSETMQKPYQIGLYSVRDFDTEKEAMNDAPPGPDVNPLLPLLLPTMEQAYERFLLAEAQWTIADVLCAAMLYRADLKKWPTTLEEVAKFVGRTFPRDPYTGKEIQYRLRKGMPTIGVRAPKWLVKEQGLRDQIDVSGRSERDQKRAEAYIEEKRREERRERMKELQENME